MSFFAVDKAAHVNVIAVPLTTVFVKLPGATVGTEPAVVKFSKGEGNFPSPHAFVAVILVEYKVL